MLLVVAGGGGVTEGMELRGGAAPPPPRRAKRAPDGNKDGDAAPPASPGRGELEAPPGGASHRRKGLRTLPSPSRLSFGAGI